MSRRSQRQAKRAAGGRGKTGTGQATRADFNPDYTYVKKDLRRIAILSVSFLILLIALSFVLN